MKSTSPLITNVRRFFGFSRWVVVGCAAMIPFIAFMPDDETPTLLGEVFFKSPALVATHTADGAARTVEVDHLRGEFSLTLVTPEDRKINSLISSVTLGFGFGLAFLVCHWIWRLCRNVEKGEIFTAGNLRLVRCMGWLLIAQTLLSFVVQLWAAHYIADYLTGRLSLRGLEVIKPQSFELLIGGVHSSVGFDINQLVIGLLVLCLTEVFRQGLRLKQEADLTV